MSSFPAAKLVADAYSDLEIVARMFLGLVVYRARQKSVP